MAYEVSGGAGQLSSPVAQLDVIAMEVWAAGPYMRECLASPYGVVYPQKLEGN